MVTNLGKQIKASIIKACIFCLLVLLDYAFIYIDANFSTTDLSENSFIEWGNEIQVMMMVAILIVAGRRNKKDQSVSLILAGFLTVVLIREFNNFFSDYVFKGSCTLLMIIAACVTIYFVYKWRSGLLNALYELVKSPGYSWFVAGSATVFIFSRLLGLPHLWKLLLKDNYVRIAERFAEEGVELLGYSFMLFGIIEYVNYLNNNAANKSNFENKIPATGTTKYISKSRTSSVFPS
jgi:hypothetical protein